MKVTTKSLILMTALCLTQFAHAKMNVSEAMKSLNGQYELVDGSGYCEKHVEIDVAIDKKRESKLVINKIEFDYRYTPRQVRENESKIVYGTKNNSNTAFIKFKDIGFNESDGVTGDLVGRHRNTFTISKKENSSLLRISTNASGWSLFHYACFDGGFFRSWRSKGTCTYKKM